MIEETKYLTLVENLPFTDERVNKLDSLSKKRVYTNIWLKLQIISILYYEGGAIPLHWLELSEKIRHSINDIKKTVRLDECVDRAIETCPLEYVVYDMDISFG